GRGRWAGAGLGSPPDSAALGAGSADGAAPGAVAPAGAAAAGGAGEAAGAGLGPGVGAAGGEAAIAFGAGSDDRVARTATTAPAASTTAAAPMSTLRLDTARGGTSESGIEPRCAPGSKTAVCELRACWLGWASSGYLRLARGRRGSDSSKPSSAAACPAEPSAR